MSIFCRLLQPFEVGMLVALGDVVNTPGTGFMLCTDSTLLRCEVSNQNPLLARKKLWYVSDDSNADVKHVGEAHGALSP